MPIQDGPYIKQDKTNTTTSAAPKQRAAVLSHLQTHAYRKKEHEDGHRRPYHGVDAHVHRFQTQSARAHLDIIAFALHCIALHYFGSPKKEKENQGWTGSL